MLYKLILTLSTALITIALGLLLCACKVGKAQDDPIELEASAGWGRPNQPAETAEPIPPRDPWCFDFSDPVYLPGTVRDTILVNPENFILILSPEIPREPTDWAIQPTGPPYFGVTVCQGR